MKVPPGIASVFNSVGNPINQMAYSLDCFLIDLTKINIIYFKKTIFNISAVTTCFIYLYVYL